MARRYERIFFSAFWVWGLKINHQIQLNAITETLVVFRGDNEISQEDIDTIAELSKWINYEFKEL